MFSSDKSSTFIKKKSECFSKYRHFISSNWLEINRQLNCCDPGTVLFFFDKHDDLRRAVRVLIRAITDVVVESVLIISILAIPKLDKQNPGWKGGGTTQTANAFARWHVNYSYTARTLCVTNRYPVLVS